MSSPVDSRSRSLTRRAVGAGTSVVAMTGIEYLMLLARTLTLARLLDPREFGLMGIAFIAINTGEVLSQTGFNRALTQRKDDPQPYLDTAWSVAALRGLLLTGAMMVLAPLLGLFFQTPEVVPVLRAVSLIMVLRGLASPRWLLFERELRPAAFYFPRLTGGFLDLVVTIVLAYQLRSVWAMVIGFLCGSVVLTATTHVLAPYRPRFHIKLAQARELYGFGRHVFRQDLLGTLSEQADRLAIGRLADVTQLGLYAFAYRLVAMPTRLLQVVSAVVVFPAFARIQDERARVREAFGRLLGVFTSAAFPLAAGLCSLAPELVLVVFGPKWEPMTVCLRILSLLCATAAVEQVCSALAGSLGRPDVPARIALLKLVVIAGSILPATWTGGIEGAACAVVSAATLSAALLFWRVSRLTGAGVRSQLASFGVPATASILLVLAVTTARWLVAGPPGPVRLVSCAVAGGGAYVVSALILDRWCGSGLLRSIQALMRSR